MWGVSWKHWGQASTQFSPWTGLVPLHLMRLILECWFQFLFFSDHVNTYILRWGHSCVETRTLCSRGRRSWSTRSPSWATPKRVPASSSSSTCSSSSLGPKGRRSCRSVELLGGNHTYVIAIQLIQKFSVHYWLLFSSSWWPCQPPPKVCHRECYKSIILLGRRTVLLQAHQLTPIFSNKLDHN